MIRPNPLKGSPTTSRQAYKSSNKMAMDGTRAFYKGTSIQCPYVDTDDFMKVIHKGSNHVMVESLKADCSLETQKKMYIKQLDAIEEALCKYQGIHGLGNKMKGNDVWKWLDEVGRLSGLNVSGKTLIMLWFMNIAALLKLKVIENDDKNGWLVTKIKGGKAVVHA